MLRWMTEVSSSVYATPLIHDLYSDGNKDVIVPTFVHYLEVLPHMQRVCCHRAAKRPHMRYKHSAQVPSLSYLLALVL